MGVAVMGVGVTVAGVVVMGVVVLYAGAGLALKRVAPVASAGSWASRELSQQGTVELPLLAGGNREQ
jgi:hypothetical protein